MLDGSLYIDRQMFNFALYFLCVTFHITNMETGLELDMNGLFS